MPGSPRPLGAPRLVLRESIPAEPQFDSRSHLQLREGAIAAAQAGLRQSIEFLVNLARAQAHPDAQSMAFQRTLVATVYGFLSIRDDAQNALSTIRRACAAFDKAPHLNVPVDLLRAGAGLHACTWVLRLVRAHPDRRTHTMLSFARAAEHQARSGGDATVYEVALWATDQLMEHPERLRRAHYQEVLGYRLMLLGTLQRQPELIATLKEQYELEPDSADSAALLAHQYERMGNTTRATAWLDTALEKWHADLDCLSLQASVTERLQAAGVPLLERAVTSIQEVTLRSPLSPHECAAVLLKLVDLRPPPEQCCALLLEARRHAPLSPQDAIHLSRLLVQPGGASASPPEAARLAANRQAQEVLRVALDHHPQSMPVRRELLKVAKLLDDRQAISVAYLSLARREPDNLGQLRAAAAHFAGCHAYRDAAEMLVLARKVEPQNLLLCLDLARYGRAANKPRLRNDIQAALRTALQLQPEHPEALLLLGHLRHEGKQYAAAQQLFERAAAAGTVVESAAALEGACAAVRAQLAPLIRSKKLPPALLQRHAELEAGQDAAPAEQLPALCKLLDEAREAARAPMPKPQVEVEPVEPLTPLPNAAPSDPLQTVEGKIVGVNYNDEAVLLRADGSMAWSPNGGYADRWLRHAPDPVAKVPAAHRHTLPAAVRAELDALLELPVVGTRTLGDFVTALAGHAPGRAAPADLRPELCVLRGSRVHHVLLKHFAQQSSATPQSMARLQYLEDRARSGVVSDIDLGTSLPPQQAYDRCVALSPNSLGACGAGGVASTLFTQYHGVNTYHDHPGAALHLDVASFCTAGSLAGRRALEGAHGQVYPKVFGTCLKAWAQVQAFAPLFYDFHTGEILDPTGAAWDDLQQGVLRIASPKSHANPMLALLAAKQAPLQLSIPAADLQIIRQQAAGQLSADLALTASLIARAAPEGLASAAALLHWVHGPLRDGLRAMQLGHVYKTCLAPCRTARVVEAYRRRAFPGTFQTAPAGTLPETLEAASGENLTRFQLRSTD